MALSTDELVRELMNDGLGKRSAELLAGFMQPTADLPSPVPPSTLPQSWLVADTPAQAAGRLVFSETSQIVGDDLALSDDQRSVNILTDGLYIVYVEPAWDVSVDFDGVVTCALTEVFTTQPTLFYWNFGQQTLTLKPSTLTMPQIVPICFPPAWLSAGDHFGLSMGANHVAAGSASVHRDTSVQVARVV